MKTLIIFTTKHGATLKIAERIAKYIDNATLLDLNSNRTFSVADYDCIILGSPITAGMIHKKVKDFAKTNLNELTKKQVGLFVSGLQAEGEAAYFQQNFPAKLLAEATVTAFLGGIFDPEKCGFVARKMIKAIAKLDRYTSTIDEEKIKTFSAKLMH
jgi:menaquinone-dependent protoporphyrinogen IX oxidase